MSAAPNDQTLIVGTRRHEGNRLACPTCGETTGTHMDTVQVAARREDGPFTHVEVDAVTGDATPSSATPQGTEVGEGRRHRIAVGGWCELCSAKFALVFTQHKGVTFVEWTLV